MEPIQVFWQNIMQNFGGYVPSLIAALAILLIGWLVAWAVSAGLRALLRRTKLDNKLAQWVAGDKGGTKIPAEQWISKGVFYLIMLFPPTCFFLRSVSKIKIIPWPHMLFPSIGITFKKKWPFAFSHTFNILFGFCNLILSTSGHHPNKTSIEQ